MYLTIEIIVIHYISNKKKEKNCDYQLMQEKDHIKLHIHSVIKSKANQERKRHCLNLINSTFKQKPTANRILNDEESKGFPFKSEISQGCPITTSI